VHADNASSTQRGGSLARDQRLRRPGEFAAILDARRDISVRASGAWLSMTAAWTVAAGGRRVRLGVTVGKRLARRSVDRTLVKRIVREAFRHAAPILDDESRRAGVEVDVCLRLKSPMRPPGTPDRPALRPLRRALRVDADQLLARLATRLSALDAHV
jgi:ribonuclease P protein component